MDRVSKSSQSRKMPRKGWIKLLPDGFHLVVGQNSLLGIWYSFSVVLVYDGECITRYDMAHGRAHRDVLGKVNGLIRKEWCDKIPAKEAFQNAIKDLSLNYRAHLEFYLGN